MDYRTIIEPLNSETLERGDPLLRTSALIFESETEGIPPDMILSGATVSRLTVDAGYIQSSNFVQGASGWSIDADGQMEMSSGTFRGNLAIGSGNNIILADPDHATWRLGIGNADIASAPFRVDKDGNVTATGATINDTTLTNSAFYGDGSDGDYTWDGGSVANLIEAHAGSGVLLRDAFFDNLTLGVTDLLKTGGYRMFVKSTFLVQTNSRAGYSGNDGGTGVNGALTVGGEGGSAGIVLVSGSMPGTVDSPIGGVGGEGKWETDGLPGGDAPTGLDVAHSCGVSGENEQVNKGGVGGDTTNYNGGIGGKGQAGTAIVAKSQPRALYSAAQMLDWEDGTPYIIQSSAPSRGGGGGGGGTGEYSGADGSAGGGGGGGGGTGGSGGVAWIAARNITLEAGGTIEVMGGDGGRGGDGADGHIIEGTGYRAGGGGGGQGGFGGTGGVAILFYNNLTGAGTVDVSGGAAGAVGLGGSAQGAAGGQNGDDGDVGAVGIDGTVIIIQN